MSNSSTSIKKYKSIGKLIKSTIDPSHFDDAKIDFINYFRGPIVGDSDKEDQPILNHKIQNQLDLCESLKELFRLKEFEIESQMVFPGLDTENNKMCQICLDKIQNQGYTKTDKFEVDYKPKEEEKKIKIIIGFDLSFTRMINLIQKIELQMIIYTKYNDPENYPGKHWYPKIGHVVFICCQRAENAVKMDGFYVRKQKSKPLHEMYDYDEYPLDELLDGQKLSFFANFVRKH